MTAVWSLWRRELVRFFRQPSRVAGAIGSPLLFWLFIGSGLSGSFRLPGAEGLDYLEYFFPGTVTLVVLFAAIAMTIRAVGNYAGDGAKEEDRTLAGECDQAEKECGIGETVDQPAHGNLLHPVADEGNTLAGRE